jgi:hypothetical protein
MYKSVYSYNYIHCSEYQWLFIMIIIVRLISRLPSLVKLMHSFVFWWSGICGLSSGWTSISLEINIFPPKILEGCCWFYLFYFFSFHRVSIDFMLKNVRRPTTEMKMTPFRFAQWELVAKNFTLYNLWSWLIRIDETFKSSFFHLDCRIFLAL